jgi:hypothetical protein
MLFSRRELLLPSHTFSEGRNHQDNYTENRPFNVGIYKLREKSGTTDFLRVIFLLKLLLSVQAESFTEALYRLVQQTIPSFGSNYGQTPG